MRQIRLQSWPAESWIELLVHYYDRGPALIQNYSQPLALKVTLYSFGSVKSIMGR